MGVTKEILSLLLQKKRITDFNLLSNKKNKKKDIGIIVFLSDMQHDYIALLFYLCCSCLIHDSRAFSFFFLVLLFLTVLSVSIDIGVWLLVREALFFYVFFVDKTQGKRRNRIKYLNE
jgi:hypothetical protein